MISVDWEAVEDGADHSFINIAEPVLINQHGLFSDCDGHMVLEKAV